MIQTWARLEDLVPTEAQEWPWMQDRIARYQDSILQGWQTTKRINPDGTLAKGNATYYICETHQIPILPLDIQWFLGLHYDGVDLLFIRENILQTLTGKLKEKRSITHQTQKIWSFQIPPPTQMTQLAIFKRIGTFPIPNHIKGLTYEELGWDPLAYRWKDLRRLEKYGLL